MSDYISREAAVKIAQKYGLANGSALGRHTGLADCIAIEIEGLPAADVEPVVRCKDCKHLRVCNQKDIYAFCPKPTIVFLPFEKDTRTFFCSYGERRKSNENHT